MIGLLGQSRNTTKLELRLKSGERALYLAMGFKWDTTKALETYQKHGVTFYEATTVFGNPLAITFPDPGHSIGEGRYITLGMSTNAQTIVIAHADRAERVRIISARRATPGER